MLVGHGEGLWFDEFQIVVQRWQTLADADGAHGDHERAHSGRDAHVSIERVRLVIKPSSARRLGRSARGVRYGSSI